MTREERIMAIVMAPGTEIYPSKINRCPQRFVVVNGLTGLDACELSTEAAFDALLREEDGESIPTRVDFVLDTQTGTPSLRVTSEPRVPQQATTETQ